MQTELGSPLARETIPVQYAYVARYTYSDVVVQNDNFLRLSAYSDPYQTPVACDVATIPQGHQIVYPDRLGNTVHRVLISAPHQELIIAATGRVGLNDRSPDVPDVMLAGAEYGRDAHEFLTASRLADPATVAEAARTAGGGASTLLETVDNVVRWIYDNVRYERGYTSVNTMAADVLEAMSGVCQDMTHLGLAMLRYLGIPARYVSGLLTRQPGDTHAWLEFLHPQLGWLPADPTRGLIINTGADYLKFGVGRDYSEVPPVSGSFVSRGSGGLDFATAEVFFDREWISMDDAFALLESGSIGTGGVNRILLNPRSSDALHAKPEEHSRIMVEPRSITYGSDRWLTDSRVYNLIWLGRWLERADNIARVVNTFARMAVANGSDMLVLQQSLETAAAIRGISIEEPGQSLAMLLKDHGASSIYHSLATARGNATHVGTVELIRAMSEAVLTLEDDAAMPATPLDALLLTNEILERLNAVYKIIDDNWFHQEALSEEAAYRRVVQQQQQQQ